MKCLECQERLQRRLDGVPPHDEPAIQQHLAGCPACRAQSAAATQLLRGLQQRASPAAPPELSRRITTAVLRDRALRQRRMQRRLYVTAALAASVVLMLLVSYALQPAHLPAPPQSAPAHAEQRERAVPLVPAPEPRAESLVERTREQLDLLLPAIAPEVAMERLADLEPFDPATQSLKHAGQEVTASLQTVTRSARQAFDYFSRELPVLDLTTRE